MSRLTGLMDLRESGAGRSMGRRGFCRLVAGAAVAPLASYANADPAGQPAFETRGVVLIPSDLAWPDWPKRAAAAGLNTIALHHGNSVMEVVRFIESTAGFEFVRQCSDLGLHLEFELHAMSDLLPRSLYESDKTLFRLADDGSRSKTSNLCVHSRQALEIVAGNAVAISRKLRPTTGRYFFWGDDGAPWCRCPQCREFTDSDQALILENHLIKTLRKINPRAQLAHLAYANTLQPPRKVKPEPGVFLEYAPINRRYDRPYADQSSEKDSLENLDANLAIFPAATAQALEYWLDVSRFSGWRRPAKKLPWNRDVYHADLRFYRSRGIRHITSFACYIDADYLKLYGEPDGLKEYGAGLSGR